MSVEVAPSQLRLRLPSPSTLRSASPRLRLPPPPPPPPPPPFSYYTLQKLPPLPQDLQPLGSGLRTPPGDDMSPGTVPGAAYHSASTPPSCDTHSLHSSYPVSFSQTTRLRAFSGSSSESRITSHHDRCLAQPEHPLPAPTAQSGSSNSIFSTSHACSAAKSSCTSVSASLACPSDSSTGSKSPADSLIYHSLQIPKCISPHGGHLPDFAAQMTCLFWFVSLDELKAAASTKPRPSNAPFPRLPDLAKPHDQFRKWVSNVLSTTQVTQNVILLALLFIYRLKMSTPQIMGRAGSEYRLLTIALMLGNKFLDDNTYTNKTWAEVSSFAVQEIHVMEVEFLSNMRYNLLASKQEWEGWLDKLARFHQYYQWATKAPPSPTYISSPSPRDLTSPIASPSSVSFPTPDLPAYTPYTPGGTMQIAPDASRCYRDWVGYDHRPPSPRPSSLKTLLTRKRSPETELAEYPAKRQVIPCKAAAPGYAVLKPVAVADCCARLPAPHPSVVTNHDSGHAGPYPTTGPYHPQASTAASTAVSLPPPQLGMRTVPVYQPAPLITSQPALGTVGGAAAAAGMPANPVPATGYAGASFPSFNYNTPGKLRSPSSLAAYALSPMVEPMHAPPNSASHTPMAHTPMTQSPSVYLQQRSSPYRPIRHVNTLLYPPPSASLDQYHLAVPVQPVQMHYQPLGRPNDLRPGIVPEFLVYNAGQHRPAPTPSGLQGALAP